VHKAYRVGQRTKKSDTLVGAALSWLAAPVRNLGELRRLDTYGANDQNDPDVLWALRDVSFDVSQGETLGIIGRNGAGKSTLLKVLSRITEPTSGQVVLNGRVASLLEVGTGFHPELTGRENVYMNGAILGMSGTEISRKFDEIVEFAGVERFIDTPIKRYSSGMQLRLAFAVAANLEPEILIVDEVLAVGDAEFQRRCLGKMGSVVREGRTVLLVSHNMAAIKSLCKRCIVLKAGRVDYIGDVASSVERYLHHDVPQSDDEEIPSDARTSSSGEAFLRRVRFAEPQHRASREVCYGEPIRLVIEYEVKQHVREALIDVALVSHDGVAATYAASTLDGSPGVALKPGARVCEVAIDNLLQPGTYSLTLGIHYPTGHTIDFIENVYKFNVSRAGRIGEPDYPYTWTRGYARVDSRWTLG
jgi:lipopolysaccharide transport system ATP-binding protein